jgi:hypothetical protein
LGRSKRTEQENRIRRDPQNVNTSWVMEEIPFAVEAIMEDARIIWIVSVIISNHAAMKTAIEPIASAMMVTNARTRRTDASF